MVKHDTKVLALLESPAGGEEIATNQLLAACRSHGAIVKIKKFNTLKQTDIFHIASYIAKNCLSSIKVSLTSPGYQNIYTPTFSTCLGAVIASFFSQKKVFFHYHGNRIPTYPDKNLSLRSRGIQNFKRKIFIGLHYFCFLHISKCFVPTSQVKNYLLREWPILQEKIVVLENGVNLKHFHPISVQVKNKLRKQLQLGKSDLVISIVGRVDKQKNTLESLNVITEIQKLTKKELCLILAYSSDGTDESYLQDCLSYLNNSNLVSKVFRNFPAITDIYQCSDCVLTNSRQEVSTLVLLESLASGIPFFATRNGTTEHILKPIDPQLILPNNPVQAASKVFKYIYKTSSASRMKKFSEYIQKRSWESISLTLLLELQGKSSISQY